MPASIIRFFQDKHGRIVIWQRPNGPLITWFIAMILSKILPYGQLNFVAELVSFGALFTWAWLEIFQGNSYFRRSVGAVVMLIIILSRI
jgi:hypothetical protein